MSQNLGFLFGITNFLWFLSEIMLNRLLRTKTGDKQNADKGTLAAIWITIVVCISLSVYISIVNQYRIADNLMIPYLGLSVVNIGIVFRLLSVRSLGKFFTVSVTIRQDHQLKTDGFYKYLRHPSYAASLISFVGLGVALNNWISLGLLSVAIFSVFVIRIRVEEKVLVEQFGDQYLEYKKSTWALIPFVF